MKRLKKTGYRRRLLILTALIALMIGLGTVDFVFPQGTGTERPPVESGTMPSEVQSPSATATSSNPYAPFASLGPPLVDMTPRPSGIYADRGTLWSHGNFSALNVWWGSVNGQPTEAYAGVLRDNASQGEVAIVIYPTLTQDFGFRIDGLYPTPRASGPVKVVSEAAGVLSLRAKNGDQFIFDLVSRTFLSNH